MNKKDQNKSYVLVPESSETQHNSDDSYSFNAQKLLAILRRRTRLTITVFIGTVALGTFSTFYQRTFSPVYQGGFSLLVSDPINPAESTQGGNSTFREAALQSSETKATRDLIDVLKSPYLVGPIAKKLDISQGALTSGLTISPRSGENSGVLDVSLLWNNPNEGQRILNLVSEDYLAYSLRERRDKLTQGLSFLDEQAPAMQKQVSDLQQQLSTFRSTNSYLEPTEQGGAIQQQRQRLEDLNKELLRKEADLLGLINLIKSNSTAARSSNILISSVRQATSSIDEVSLMSFNNLQTELTTLEKDLAVAEATFKPASTVVQSIRARILKLRPLAEQRLMDAIQASLSSVQGERAEVERQKEQLTKQFSQNPTQIKQYDELRQRLDVSRENMTAYLKARENFRLEVAQRTVPWRIVSPPYFGSTLVKPTVKKNIFLAVLLGAAAGIGSAILRDSLDRVYHNTAEVSDGLGVPLLGGIPFLEMEEEKSLPEHLQDIDEKGTFILKESLRSLYTSLRLLRADKPLRLIGITSTVQKEGKSLIVSLFAQTLADLGQRVLVVDADMRSPAIHKYMGVKNNQGFSSVLTDPYTKIERVIQPLSDTLHIITAGPIPPDSPRVLSSRRCSEVVSQINEMTWYDMILFDTPPALYLSDPLLLSESLEGMIMVVCLRKVAREKPPIALRRLMTSGVDVLGIVANQVHYGDAVNGEEDYSYQYGKGKEKNKPAETTDLDINSDENDIQSKPPLRQRITGIIRFLDERI